VRERTNCGISATEAKTPSWIHAQAPGLFPAGDPAKGTGDLGLPPLEPRALDKDQIRTLKNLCDRLERFHRLSGRRW